MPKSTDSDLNRIEDRNIIFIQNVECPNCEDLVEAYFDTGARDEDGLTDLAPGDLRALTVCPGCGEDFEAVYDGWVNYGDA